MPGSFFDRCARLHRVRRSRQGGSRGGDHRPWRSDHVQVLNELANVARRKLRMSWADTHTLLSTLRGLLTVHSVTVEVHETGLALAERDNLSTFDA